jgi:hypothetical protein
MDIAVWRALPDEYLVIVETITMDSEISDLVVDGDVFVVAFVDGTVEKHGRFSGAKTVFANHKSGPVALGESHSLGVEMRISLTR